MLPFMSAALATVLTVAPVGGTPCNHEASVTHAAAPIYPDPSIWLRGAYVLVQVSLDATGALSDASVVSSSGYDLFDGAALTAAQDSTYSPQVVNCKPTAGKYAFRVEFNSRTGPSNKMPVPRFAPGTDWSPADATKFGDGLNAVGKIVGAWSRGDTTLRIAEYITPDGDLSLDNAAAFVQTRFEHALEISGENTQSAALCNGKRPAEEFLYQFTSNKDAKQSAVFITVIDGTIYTIGYTMPQSAPLDSSVLTTAVEPFCG